MSLKKWLCCILCKCEFSKTDVKIYLYYFLFLKMYNALKLWHKKMYITIVNCLVSCDYVVFFIFDRQSRVKKVYLFSTKNYQQQCNDWWCNDWRWKEFLMIFMLFFFLCTDTFIVHIFHIIVIIFIFSVKLFHFWLNSESLSCWCWCNDW